MPSLERQALWLLDPKVADELAEVFQIVPSLPDPSWTPISWSILLSEADEILAAYGSGGKIEQAPLSSDLHSSQSRKKEDLNSVLRAVFAAAVADELFPCNDSAIVLGFPSLITDRSSPFVELLETLINDASDFTSVAEPFRPNRESQELNRLLLSPPFSNLSPSPYSHKQHVQNTINCLRSQPFEKRMKLLVVFIYSFAMYSPHYQGNGLHPLLALPAPHSVLLHRTINHAPSNSQKSLKRPYESDDVPSSLSTLITCSLLDPTIEALPPIENYLSDRSSISSAALKMVRHIDQISAELQSNFYEAISMGSLDMAILDGEDVQQTQDPPPLSAGLVDLTSEASMSTFTRQSCASAISSTSQDQDVDLPPGWLLEEDPGEKSDGSTGAFEPDISGISMLLTVTQLKINDDLVASRTCKVMPSASELQTAIIEEQLLRLRELHQSVAEAVLNRAVELVGQEESESSLLNLRAELSRRRTLEQ